MAGDRTPGPIGSGSPPSLQDLTPSARGGFGDPGPIGGDDEAIALGATDVPIVKGVTKVWDTKARTTTPAIDAKGATLAEVKADLDASQGKHWGEGGGKLKMDDVPKTLKRGDTFVVTLRGEFINRIPKWVDRDKGSAAAKAEWDRFIGKLSEHEEGHVAIALKSFEDLATALVGVKITDLTKTFNDSQAALKADQKKMDTDTDNGTKAGVKYGDALLDTSIK